MIGTGPNGETPSGRSLSDADVAALADALADRLLPMLAAADGGALLDTADVARRLGRSPDWVRRNSDALGVVRLGDGPKSRLGFEPAKVAAYLASCSEGRGTPTRESALQAGSPAPHRRRPAPLAKPLPKRRLVVRGERP